MKVIKCHVELKITFDISVRHKCEKMCKNCDEGIGEIIHRQHQRSLFGWVLVGCSGDEGCEGESTIIA